MEEVERLALHLPGPLTIVGNCSGAILGLLLAQRQPHAVKRLTMIDAFAFTPWYFRVFTSRWGAAAYYSTFANRAGRWLTNASLRAKRRAGTDLTKGFRSTDHPMTLAYLRIFEEAAGLLEWDAIHTPVDLLYGERTFRAVRESVSYFAQRLTVDRTVCLKGAGHLPLLEATEQLRSLLFAQDHSGGLPCTTPNRLRATAR